MSESKPEKTISPEEIEKNLRNENIERRHLDAVAGNGFEKDYKESIEEIGRKLRSNPPEAFAYYNMSGDNIKAIIIKDKEGNVIYYNEDSDAIMYFVENFAAPIGHNVNEYTNRLKRRNED